MTDLEKYQIRDARLDDCKDLARMIDGSSDGAVTYLYENLKPGISPVDVMCEQLKSEVHYSYANSLVVECDEKIVAMALSFPSSGLQLDSNLLENFDLVRQQYFRYFIDNRINDSWHLDAIYVDGVYRSSGLGRRLLEKVKHSAIEFGFPVLQVYVFESNKAAIKFYCDNGFSQVKKIELDAHVFLKRHGSLLLMKCNLSV